MWLLRARVFTLQQAACTPAGLILVSASVSHIRFRIQWTEFSP
jgi:hypothetical protein